MTREEQIREAAKKTTGLFSYRNGYSTAEDAFVAGAEWADVNQPSPWISVEERLPRACTVPTIEQYIKNQRYWDNKTAATYLVACDSGKYYDFANYIKNGKKCYWAYNDNIIRNVTHWMPIPKLQEK